MSTNEILVPVDFSESSRAAAIHALKLARTLGGPVTFLHAVCGDPPPVAPMDHITMPATPDVIDRGVKELAEFVASLDTEGIALEEEVVGGHPATTILDRVHGRPPRMVVMGTHGRTGLARLVMGSHTEEVVRRSEVPVLVVRAPEVPATA